MVPRHDEFSPLVRLKSEPMITYAQDLQLARRVAAGDEAAFERLFAAIFPRLYRFVLLRVQRDEDLAQDVCQQTMERTLRAIASYRGEAALHTWVCQIARSEIANYWQRVSRVENAQVSIDQDDSMRAALESLSADPRLAPEAQGERWDQVTCVQAILDHLPPPYGDALEWKYIEGLSAEEIGQRLRLSATAAHSLLARARRAFRMEYEALAEGLA
jgi:RNA polymerase sigma-70 factor (ECF subfamily)